MAVSSVTTQSGTGVDGNSVTNAVSNDKLTNNDFLKLMLEEMKMQDPTKPMDSKALMDSQLKMSTIESNQNMASAMEKLQASYSASALSTAANMINHHVKDGTKNDKGEEKVYKVMTVENKDGDLYMNVVEAKGIKDSLKNTVDNELMLYNPTTGVILNKDGTETDYKVSLDEDGRFEANEDKSLKLLNKSDSTVVTDAAIKEKYVASNPFTVYSDTPSQLLLSKVTEVK